METSFPYEEKTLSNGLRIMMIHNKEWPFIRIRFVLDRGSLWDPPKKAGLGFLTAQSLKQGTRFHNYLQLTYAFDQIGSELNVEVDFDSISFSASTLSKYSGSLLRLMKQVLLLPRMDKKDFLKERYRLLQSLKALPDNQDSFATRLFYQELFPSSLLYGRPQKGWQHTVRRIRHEDIVRHYFQHYRPNHSTLVVSGKISDHFIQKIKKSFRGWKNAKTWRKAYVPQWHKGEKEKDTSPPRSPQKRKRHLKILHQNGLELSYLLLGSRGKPRRYEKDKSLALATLALGSGSSSRLYRALREKKNLVYKVSAQQIAWKESGAFIIKATTTNQNTARALSKILSLFARWQKQGITSEELKKARNKYQNHFISLGETSENTANILASLQALGFEKPYSKWKSSLEEIKRTSRSDIKKALKEVLSSPELQVLLIGDKDQMDLEKIQKLKWDSFKTLPLKEALQMGQ